MIIKWFHGFFSNGGSYLIIWLIIVVLAIIGFIILYRRAGIQILPTSELSGEYKTEAITVETLSKFLKKRYPVSLTPEKPNERFIEVLIQSGYSTIGQLSDALSKSQEAFNEWQIIRVKEGYSHPDQIGIVLRSLEIYDCNFYRIFREGTKEEWLECYGQYHSFIKGGAIPCR